MADEINRASPRTQSALLQAMQEYKVSVAGQDHDLPKPFHVLATQNPLELEGTYPLPEAQLDRFLLQIDVGYPDEASEKRMLIATTGVADEKPEQVLTADELIAAQRLVRSLPVGDAVADAILKLVRAGRPNEHGDPSDSPSSILGPGPPSQPGADARHPGARPAAGPFCAVDRRCGHAGAPGSEASYGAGVLGPRGRDHRRRRHRPALRDAGVSIPNPARNDAVDAVAVRHRAEEAASALPPLLAMAEQVATVVAQGEHGRRRAGTGDSFWQYRRYQAGDPVQNIDWRQSAKSRSPSFVKTNGNQPRIFICGPTGRPA